MTARISREIMFCRGTIKYKKILSDCAYSEAEKCAEYRKKLKAVQ